MTVFIINGGAEEQAALRGLLRDTLPLADIYALESATPCAETAKTCDIAFTCLGDKADDTLRFARECKERYPKANLIFIADSGRYKAQAMDLRASGYLTRPVAEDALREELANLRYPLPDGRGETPRLRLQCFGNFEALIDAKPIHFRYDKAKELLAYLTDARSMCSNEELMAALWETEVSASYFRNVRKDLIDAFRRSDCDDILTRWRGQIGLNPDKVSCDYYDFLQGDPESVKRYWGEYMRQYEWAQYTNSRLSQILESGEGG